MSVRELVFEYTSKGARQAARADRRVRESVSRTGREARKQSGAVERWMERNREAIQSVALATAAAVGGILAAAPQLRASLGGVRAAMTLLATTIVDDLLPGAGSFGTVAVDLVQNFRDIDDQVRTVLSGLTVLAGVMAGIALVVSGPVSILVGAFLVLTTAAFKFLDAILDLNNVLSGYRALIQAVSRALRGDFSGALRLAREGFRDLWLAGEETRRKVINRIQAMVAGVITRVIQLRNQAVRLFISFRNGVVTLLTAVKNRAIQIFNAFRDGVVSTITKLKDRVLQLLDIASDIAATGREWIEGLIRGVLDRAGQLTSAFGDLASDAASAFVDTFNDIIPSTISIPSRTFDIPDILGGGSVSIGGGSLDLPQLDTGGRVSATGLAMIHEGERIMPAAQVRDRGEQPTGGGETYVENVNIMVRPTDDPMRQGRDIARSFQQELDDRGA